MTNYFRFTDCASETFLMLTANDNNTFYCNIDDCPGHKLVCYEQFINTHGDVLNTDLLSEDVEILHVVYLGGPVDLSRLRNLVHLELIKPRTLEVEVPDGLKKFTISNV